MGRGEIPTVWSCKINSTVVRYRNFGAPRGPGPGILHQLIIGTDGFMMDNNRSREKRQLNRIGSRLEGGWLATGIRRAAT